MLALALLEDFKKERKYFGRGFVSPLDSYLFYQIMSDSIDAGRCDAKSGLVM